MPPVDVRRNPVQSCPPQRILSSSPNGRELMPRYLWSTALPVFDQIECRRVVGINARKSDSLVARYLAAPVSNSSLRCIAHRVKEITPRCDSCPCGLQPESRNLPRRKRCKQGDGYS